MQVGEFSNITASCLVSSAMQYKSHDYFTAAHVQMLRQRHLQGCSTLDVAVLQCWELRPGVCAANGTRLSIPACHNCGIYNVTVGGEYLIAGLHDANVGMFLPNYKKGGLLGVWMDKKYRVMSEWVQLGISFKKINADSDCDA